jgi:hypothetical protein
MGYNRLNASGSKDILLKKKLLQNYNVEVKIMRKISVGLSLIASGIFFLSSD